MDKLQSIVTDSLLGMLTAVTGLVPPEGPPPQFIQAAIDRAAERIRAEVVPVAVESAAAIIETKLNTFAMPLDCLPMPRWVCERLLESEPSPWRANAETVVSELLRGVVPTEPADHDAPRQVRLLLAEVARLRQLARACDSDDIPPEPIANVFLSNGADSFDDIPDFGGSGNKARRRAESLGIWIEPSGPFRLPEGIDSEGGSCD